MTSIWQNGDMKALGGVEEPRPSFRPDQLTGADSTQGSSRRFISPPYFAVVRYAYETRLCALNRARLPPFASSLLCYLETRREAPFA